MAPGGGNQPGVLDGDGDEARIGAEGGYLVLRQVEFPVEVENQISKRGRPDLQGDEDHGSETFGLNFGFDRLGARIRASITDEQEFLFPHHPRTGDFLPILSDRAEIDL